MNKVQSNSERLFTLFDSGDLRQRIVVTIAIFIVIYVAWDQFIYQPMLQHHDSIVDQRNTIAQLSNALPKTQKLVNLDKYNDKIRTITDQIEQLDKQIALITSELIAPDQMPDVLQQLLEKSARLRVKQLHTEPAQLVNQKAMAAASESPVAPIYKHTR